MTALIHLTLDGKVATLTMNDGQAVSKNAHNLAFATELLAKLEEVEANKNIKSLIITSDDGKNWSQGIDVPWFLGLIQKQDFEPLQTFLRTMDQVYSKLMSFPVPVIAAINGHTFGNGCVLAAACDFRIMRKDRGYVCFPEIDLGIPFLPGLVDVILKAFPHKTFNQMILTGKKYTAEEMQALGVIEFLADDQESLQTQASSFAKEFNKKRPIFSDHKKKLNEKIVNTMLEKNLPAIENKAFFLQ
ncbi:enoyl-CoA hydratase/isomerase family protein [Litoribrevibacter euphylliae]|uniref:Enoyl-CoA hydratase/isomerase family protein n=1 Tax=Litoribrevibacter euphylliae TaxID=1834034 RepID=A0ABV7HBE0_9GAMM